MTGTGKMKKKYASGEASWYLTRKQALKKLQINLRDFRRLCIMKGVHPREPIKRSRAQKGSTEHKTLYYKKDIQFMLHEPMIWKMWDNKALHKKIIKAVGKGDRTGAKRLTDRRSKYQLDHIVKERYPTFSDALGDMDDALTLCSLFAIMPALFRVSTEVVSDCRRLTVEFMHYVIESRALRKAFISIKGYYFQAEIQGHTVTWVIPHHFVYTRPQDVDLKVMTLFCEFYTTFLGFVNYRLYNSINLFYPPRLAITSADGGDSGQTSRDISMSVDELLEERVAALNCPLHRVKLAENDNDGDNSDDEETEMALMSMASGDELKSLQEKRQRVKNTQKLFENLRFFIGREVPREPFVLLIRSLGGVCSWDSSCASGATYGEHDQSITHQIIDRKMTGNKYTSRYYIQPQWVFDCLNAGQLRPVQLYFPGVELPPHLSPFKQEEVSWGEYVPPDKIKLLNELSGEGEDTTTAVNDDDDDCDDDSSCDSGHHLTDDHNSDNMNDDSDDEIHDDSGVDDEVAKTNKMSVEAGSVEVVDKNREMMKTSREEFVLRCHMVKKKDKYKFNRLMQRKKRFEKEARKLSERRKVIDNEIGQKRNVIKKKKNKEKTPLK